MCSGYFQVVAFFGGWNIDAAIDSAAANFLPTVDVIDGSASGAGGRLLGGVDWALAKGAKTGDGRIHGLSLHGDGT